MKGWLNSLGEKHKEFDQQSDFSVLAELPFLKAAQDMKNHNLNPN